NYVYSGLDGAGGLPLPAFLVTTDADYKTLSILKRNNPTGVQGDSNGLINPLREITLPANLAALPAWLQTTSDPLYGTRAFVEQLRQAEPPPRSGTSRGPTIYCPLYF